MRSRRRTAYENIRMSALSPVSGAGDRRRLAFCIAVEVFGIQTRGRFRRIGEDKAMNRENEKTNPDNIQTEDVSEEILQNLKDAGCDEQTTNNNSVTALLEAGGRLIDTAHIYGNEAAVGRAVRDSDVPREEISIMMITSLR